MEEHQTLVDLAADREVRKSAGFREVAQKLTPHWLRALYDGQLKASPRRGDAGKPYFAPRDGTGVEFYYNVQVTPWLNVTPDLQYIRPELSRFTSGDDAFVYGLRVNMRL